jgi:hypothetical protein
MYLRKLSSLVLGVFASFVLVVSSTRSTGRLSHDQQSNGTSTHPCVADGGAPVPPYPKPPATINLKSTVIADGGLPVSPYPQPPVSGNPQLVLLADGGAPVPPYPPPRPPQHSAMYPQAV